MRKLKGSIAHVAEIIEQDIADRNTNLSKPQRAGLADLVASILTIRNINTSELASVLPREVKSDEERFRFIYRWLSNKKIEPNEVMFGFIPELLELTCLNGKIAVLMMDQSIINNGFECLMISIRIAERALPVVWKIVKTEGNIGFEEQKILLEKVKAMIPDGLKILFTADRFYGTARLIQWCQDAKWQYRIRLKGNLTLQHQGGEMQTKDILNLGVPGITNAELYESNVITSIGVLRETGHAEAWIIAMDGIPTKARILDYGMRWGIEALFSDFKSRGFGIQQTQLKTADRIERLILLLTIAFYWATSTGLQPRPNKRELSKKKP